MRVTEAKKILLFYQVDNFDELNNNAPFRRLLAEICKNRGEEFYAWRSCTIGFALITDQSYCEFSFDLGKATCMLDAKIRK